jgi:hypothetical protein
MTRSLRIAMLLCAVLVSLLTWFSGPPAYDLLDGTEFVICGRELAVPHPPGYPLYIFFLRAASGTLPVVNPDYHFFRGVSAIIAGAAFLAGTAAMMSFGAGAAASVLGSLLFFTLTPVLMQMNLVEVHGLAILLLLSAAALRRTRCGPYAFSLALFGGHAMSVFMLPAILNRRFRERWLLLALLPASLMLFLPLRSMLPSMVHYDKPTLQGLLHYLSTYSSYFNTFIGRAADSLAYDLHPVTIAILTSLLILAGKPSWRLLAASATCFIFLSFYAIADTGSMTWAVLLPLVIWASPGIDRLLRSGRTAMILALVMVFSSAALGILGAWRADDQAADTISRDCLRGIGPEGVYITIGFNAFCTAYLMEVLDMRPDILPMDASGCYFSGAVPKDYPSEWCGRPVYANKAWDRPRFEPHGILFSADSSQVDWSMYDLFWITEGVRDVNARDLLAEIWVLRGVQTENPGERALIWTVAQNWTWNLESLRLVNNRISRFGMSP